MELDELKQHWKEPGDEQIKTNRKIMDLLQNRSYGPLADMKKNFRKQMSLMLVFPFVLLSTNMHIGVEKVFSSVLFLAYLALCAGVVIFSYVNYRLVANMQMDESVKSNFEQQIAVLRKRLQWKIMALRITMLFFILLVEVLPYFQHYRMLDKWHALSPLIRYGAYASFLVLQWFMTRAVSQRKYGRHLDNLEQLVSEMK